MVLDPTVRYRNVFSNITRDGTELGLRVSSHVITACRWNEGPIPRRWYGDALRKSKSRSHDQASETQLYPAYWKYGGEGNVLIFLPFYSSCDPNQPSVCRFPADGKYNQVDSR